MRTALKIYGAIALFSALLWSVAGIPLWASIDDSFGRGYVLFILHVAGLLGGGMAWDNNLWDTK